tara:strand:- start:178 stop:297 length:120 start_codon:yes stop_codon:yes gene_type:complete
MPEAIKDMNTNKVSKKVSIILFIRKKEGLMSLFLKSAKN